MYFKIKKVKAIYIYFFKLPAKLQYKRQSLEDEPMIFELEANLNTKFNRKIYEGTLTEAEIEEIQKFGRVRWTNKRQYPLYCLYFYPLLHKDAVKYYNYLYKRTLKKLEKL